MVFTVERVQEDQDAEMTAMHARSDDEWSESHSEKRAQRMEDVPVSMKP